MVLGSHKKGIFDRNDILPLGEDGEKPPYRGFYDITSAIQFAREMLGLNFFVSPSLKTIVDGLRPNTQNPTGPVQYSIGHSSKNTIVFCNHCEKMAKEVVTFEAQKTEWIQKYENQKMRTLEAEAQIENLTKKLESLQSKNDKLTSKIVALNMKTSGLTQIDENPIYGPEPKPTSSMTAIELARAWAQQNQENSTPEVSKDQNLESSPFQTADGKDEPSPLKAGDLPKIISPEDSGPNQENSYPEILKDQNKELSPSSPVDGKNTLNPVMADSLPKTIDPVQTGEMSLENFDRAEILRQLEFEMRPSHAEVLRAKQTGKFKSLMTLKQGDAEIKLRQIEREVKKEKSGPREKESKEY